MKTISLSPYPGSVTICDTKKQYRKQHKKLFGYGVDFDIKRGRCDGDAKTGNYLVYAEDNYLMVHEMCHVVMTLFDRIGVNPADSQGEAFCYMIEHLTREANR